MYRKWYQHFSDIYSQKTQCKTLIHTSKNLQKLKLKMVRSMTDAQKQFLKNMQLQGAYGQEGLTNKDESKK